MRFIITAVFVLLPAAAAAQVAVSTPMATVEQAYNPVNLRDPLLPATVFADQKGPDQTSNEAPGAASGSPSGS